MGERLGTDRAVTFRRAGGEGASAYAVTTATLAKRIRALCESDVDTHKSLFTCMGTFI